MPDVTEQKKRYLQTQVQSVQALVGAVQAIRAARAVYDSRGYDVAGVLTDADLAAAGYGHLSAADFLAAMAAIDNVWTAPTMQTAIPFLYKMIP